MCNTMNFVMSDLALPGNQTPTKYAIGNKQYTYFIFFMFLNIHISHIYIYINIYILRGGPHLNF